MKSITTVKMLLLLVCVVPNPAFAALISRLGGLAVYDTDLDITWLADANYAVTSGYDSDGLMKWNEWVDWAEQLEFGGYANWRLPTGDTGGCYVAPGSTPLWGCTESEMGHLFYSELGNLAYRDQDGNINLGYGLVNSGPFENISTTHLYFTETILATYRDRNPDTNTQEISHDVYFFHFNSGVQNTIRTCSYSSSGSLDNGCASEYKAMAVADGDIFISAVPVPAAVWLFFSGFIGLLVAGFKNLRY